MELLENMQKELLAPGIVDRAISNLIIDQALNEVGRTGWLQAGPLTRKSRWGKIADGKYKFVAEVREDLKLKFPEETICILEEYALTANPGMG